MMSVALAKILLCLTVILILTLFVGTQAANVDHFMELSQDQQAPDSILYLAKRRFLPTRRDFHEYINQDGIEPTTDDDFHLNTKRYFLKSKRYFLNSKRTAEQQQKYE